MMKTQATILYYGSDKGTLREYEAAFKIARDRGYVGRMSVKHKQAVLIFAYHLDLRIFYLTSRDRALKDCIVWVCQNINRDELYRRLKRDHVWKAGQWIPKWHIESVKDLAAGLL